jgi:hypothetical protein
MRSFAIFIDFRITFWIAYSGNSMKMDLRKTRLSPCRDPIYEALTVNQTGGDKA